MKEKIVALMIEWFSEDDPGCVTKHEGDVWIVREDRSGFNLEKLAQHIVEGI